MERLSLPAGAHVIVGDGAAWIVDQHDTPLVEVRGLSSTLRAVGRGLVIAGDTFGEAERILPLPDCDASDWPVRLPGVDPR